MEEDSGYSGVGVIEKQETTQTREVLDDPHHYRNYRANFRSKQEKIQFREHGRGYITPQDHIMFKHGDMLLTGLHLADNYSDITGLSMDEKLDQRFQSRFDQAFEEIFPFITHAVVGKESQGVIRGLSVNGNREMMVNFDTENNLIVITKEEVQEDGRIVARPVTAHIVDLPTMESKIEWFNRRVYKEFQYGQ